MKSKKQKASEARKNAEALKAKKKQARVAKGGSGVAVATKGRKGASLVKQSTNKKKK